MAFDYNKMLAFDNANITAYIADCAGTAIAGTLAYTQEVSYAREWIGKLTDTGQTQFENIKNGPLLEPYKTIALASLYIHPFSGANDAVQAVYALKGTTSGSLAFSYQEMLAIDKANIAAYVALHAGTAIAGTLAYTQEVSYAREWIGKLTDTGQTQYNHIYGFNNQTNTSKYNALYNLYFHPFKGAVVEKAAADAIKAAADAATAAAIKAAADTAAAAAAAAAAAVTPKGINTTATTVTSPPAYSLTGTQPPVVPMVTTDFISWSELQSMWWVSVQLVPENPINVHTFRDTSSMGTEAQPTYCVKSMGDDYSPLIQLSGPAGLIPKLIEAKYRYANHISGIGVSIVNGYGIGNVTNTSSYVPAQIPSPPPPPPPPIVVLPHANGLVEITTSPFSYITDTYGNVDLQATIDAAYPPRSNDEESTYWCDFDILTKVPMVVTEQVGATPTPRASAVNYNLDPEFFNGYVNSNQSQSDAAFIRFAATHSYSSLVPSWVSGAEATSHVIYPLETYTINKRDAIVVRFENYKYLDIGLRDVSMYSTSSSFDCFKLTYADGSSGYFSCSSESNNYGSGQFKIDNLNIYSKYSFTHGKIDITAGQSAYDIDYSYNVVVDSQLVHTRTPLLPSGMQEFEFLDWLAEHTNIQRTAFEYRWLSPAITITQPNGTLVYHNHINTSSTAASYYGYEVIQDTADTRVTHYNKLRAIADLGSFQTTLRFNIFSDIDYLAGSDDVTLNLPVTKKIDLKEYPRSITLTSVDILLDNQGKNAYSSVTLEDSQGSLVYTALPEGNPTAWASGFSVKLNCIMNDAYYPNAALRFNFEDTAGVRFTFESNDPILDIDVNPYGESIALFCPMKTMGEYYFSYAGAYSPVERNDFALRELVNLLLSF